MARTVKDQKTGLDPGREAFGAEGAAAQAAQDWSAAIPKAARAPKGLFQEKLRWLPSVKLNTSSLAMEEPRAKAAGAWVFMGDADLWRPLAEAYGACDCMVDGKYKKARIFAFETPSFHIWCQTETGDRGTGWHMAPKSPSATDDEFRAFGYASLADPRTRAELADFVEGLVAGMFAANPPAVEKFGDIPYVAELKNWRGVIMEAAELAQSTKIAMATPRKPSL